MVQIMKHPLNGIEYQATPIDDATRLKDIKSFQARGNHKSSLLPEGIAAISKAYDIEVYKGWKILILPSIIPSIQNASITPLGAAQ